MRAGSWSFGVQALGGVGVVHSPEKMYEDMHNYLQGQALALSQTCCAGWCLV